MQELIDAGSGDPESSSRLGDRQSLDEPQAEHLERALIGHTTPAPRGRERQAVLVEPAQHVVDLGGAEVGVLHHLDGGSTGQLRDVDDARKVQAIKRRGPEPEPFDTHRFGARVSC